MAAQTRQCYWCRQAKPATEYSRNQIKKGALARCRLCVEAPGRHSIDAAVQQQQPQQQQQQQQPPGDDACHICGVARHGGAAHDQTKRHVTNVELSTRLDYVRIDTTGLSEAALRCAGVAKGSNWASAEQVALARSVRPIAQTGVSLVRFQAIGLRFSSSSSSKDYCTVVERELAASLIDIRSTGLQPFHFKRAFELGLQPSSGEQRRTGVSREREGTFGKWCSPSQLAAARRYWDMCRTRITDTGLEVSRFRRLGVQGEYCAQEDVDAAAALIDARKPAPGKKFAVPLGYYSDVSDVSSSDSSDELNSRARRGRRKHGKKRPIWVTRAQHDGASNRWDAAGICYDIDTQWGAMPWGGAYKDSLRYPEDGFGGYMGEGFGY